MVRIVFIPPAKAFFNLSVDLEVLACPVQAILPLQVVPGMVYEFDRSFLSEVICDMVGTFLMVFVANPIGFPFYVSR
jgi:hypothetical protein